MTVAIVFLTLTKVNSSCELADDGKVDAAAHVGLERRDFDEGVGGEVAGAQVAEGVHLLAELEEALFRADFAGAPFWTSDRSEDDGVGVFSRCEGFIG